MVKICPKCGRECSEAAKFCGGCRTFFEGTPNPTCRRGHPILPGETMCPICQSLDGKADAEEEFARRNTSVPPRMPTSPEYPGTNTGRAGTGTMIQQGAGVPGVQTGFPGPKPTGGASRGGTVVVPGPGPASPPQAERKIVAVLATYSPTAGTTGKIFPVRSGRNRIGRDPENEIAIPNDLALSGCNTYLHFYEGSGTFLISDHHSQNGTFVDDRNIEGESVKLSNYMKIRAGLTEFVLMIIDPSTAGARIEDGD